MKDIYCQLIPNDNEEIPNYEMVPRIGAFEVSINGVVSYVFKWKRVYVKTFMAVLISEILFLKKIY